MYQKKFLSLILVIVLLLIVAGSVYFFKNILSKKTPDPEFSANWNLQKRPAPFQESRIFYSGEKKYSLLIEYKEGLEGTSCKKTIFDNRGYEMTSSDTSDFLRDITCIRGMQLNLYGFKNFSEDNIVFNLLGTNITIFNIPSKKVEIITYEINESQRDYNFIAADTSLKHLLFSKDGYAFIDQVKDYDGKEVFNIQPLLHLENNDLISSYFDSVNKGILYLQESTSTQKRGYQFNYFDLKTKKMRNLKFILKNPDSVGRGCGGNLLFPEERKLIFIGKCVDVLPKDKNEAGEIILKL